MSGPDLSGSSLRLAFPGFGRILPDPKHATREAWLVAARDWLAPHFARRGYPLDRVRLSVGFPVSRGAMAECWADSVSKDATREIFVSPELEHVPTILFAVVHEIAHAVLPPHTGHGPKWAHLADSFGMTHGKGGTWTGLGGPDFLRFIEPLEQHLGPIPHAAMNIGHLPGMGGGFFAGGGGKCGGFRVKPKKAQSTRLLKCSCEDCGYTVRVTRQWLDQSGAPLCPNELHHGKKMKEPGEDAA